MMRVLLQAVLMVVVSASLSQAEQMRMAVTTSFHNSGLADILLPAILKDTGLDVQLLVVGTGQALRLGRAGDVDALLVHSPADEKEFVARGYGIYRREIMYNDFVFIGPSGDPAGISAANNAEDVMRALALAKLPFVSRGDDSGTHKKELSLWRSAGLGDTEFGAWYRAVGAGMG
ncbi:MAG: substrate-binding domain-containing protein, partial [Marinosulfonomonas sp.]|nr:substrate-binding domain-containing protein [Marinosulfonomonas sp.]